MRKIEEKPAAFPSRLPLEKPTDRPLSAATQRLYDMWTPKQDTGNRFYTIFKYSRVTGIGKDDSDMSVSRRDPSKVLKIGDSYYVWYTRRRTKCIPVGPVNIDQADDEIPVVDWDLADICFATSKDGFNWVEQGVAVPRAPKGSYGDRSLSTPDILVFKGRFYLYYQTFTTMWRKNDCVNVSAAWSDSPDGPWTRLDRPVIPQGEPGEWDSCAIHDPFPLVYKGKVWLYYKGSPVDKSPGNLLRSQGVAIADSPEGPFVKSELNPVTNSGHETMYWPYEGGIATLLILDGPEKDTIQFAPDGLNFVPKAHVQLSPIAPGPFCPDAFADDGDGRGIIWGLCHMNPLGVGNEEGLQLIRFDCDLSRDVFRPEFKRSNLHWGEGTWFQRMMELPADWRTRILAEQADFDKPTAGT